MNRIIGWMIACLLPISVLCATDNAKVCTSFTQQGRQVTFHLTDSAALQLQLCLVFARWTAATEECLFCSD